MNKNQRLNAGVPAPSEWHILSRHFATGIGRYSDKQIAIFFDVVNGKNIEPGCTKVFIGKSDSASTGVFIDLGINTDESANWWRRWDAGGNFNPGSHFFCLTDRVPDYLQDRNVGRYVENRLTAYEKRREQMKQTRLKLDLADFESVVRNAPPIAPFSEIFKTELMRHPTEDDAAHEYRVIGTVMTVFQEHPLLVPGGRLEC